MWAKLGSKTFQRRTKQDDLYPLTFTWGLESNGTAKIGIRNRVDLCPIKVNEGFLLWCSGSGDQVDGVKGRVTS